MATNGFRRGTLDDAIKSKKGGRKYFYLDNKLYKELTIIRGQDIMRAWCYTDKELVQLPLSYAKSRRKPTYTVVQAAAMMNRSRMNINHLYMFGVLSKPQKSMPMDPKSKYPGIYRLSEQDVYAIHEYYSSSRHAERYTTAARPLPSRRELAAMMKYEKITYVQTKDGEFVPIWNAPDVAEWI